MEITERYLPTDSLRFHLLTAGDGDDVILFLHGFPDAADSMVPLMKKAARDGYHAVAPYMRGYGESGPVEDGNYFVSDLARDCVAIIDGLDVDEAIVVGHDWGAAAAYAAASRSPGRISRLVTMSVPPIRVFLANCLRRPRQLYYSWYMMFFQVPYLPEVILKRNDFQFVETLWNQWSPTWNPPEEYLQPVKETFRTDWTPRAALGYYRALLRGLLSDFHRHRRSRELAFAPVQIPSLILTGGADGCLLPETFDGLERAYEADYEFHTLPSVGHFPHLEATNDVYRLLSGYLRNTEP